MILSIKYLNGIEIAPGPGDVFFLQENSHYRVFVTGLTEVPELYLGACRLELVAETSPPCIGFSCPLDVGFWVGHQSLTLVIGGKAEKFALEVLPSEKKLRVYHWPMMLRDIEADLEAASAGHEGGRQGGVERGRLSLPFLAEALLPLLPELELSLRSILEQPRRRSTSSLSQVPLHALRRVDAFHSSWFSRHPDLYRRLAGGDADLLDLRQRYVPSVRSYETLDHPANRHIHWIFLRAALALDEVAHALEKVARARAGDQVRKDTEKWCRARSMECRRGAHSLRLKLRRSKLGRVPAVPGGSAALVTILNHPGYRRADALARLFISPSFRPEGRATAVRPSFELYELWCFVELRKLIQAQLSAHLVEDGVDTVGEQWSPLDYRSLFDPHKRNPSFSSQLVRKGLGTLELHLGRPFQKYFAKKRAEPLSLLNQRIPDLCLTWKPEHGDGRWICLDVKYSVGESDIGKAMGAAHVYQHGLRWPSFGGRAIATILLVPRWGADCAEWFLPTFWTAHGVGAAELSPGSPDAGSLVRWMLDALGGE